MAMRISSDLHMVALRQHGRILAYSSGSQDPSMILCQSHELVAGAQDHAARRSVHRGAVTGTGTDPNWAPRTKEALGSYVAELGRAQRLTATGAFGQCAGRGELRVRPDLL